MKWMLILLLFSVSAAFASSDLSVSELTPEVAADGASVEVQFTVSNAGPDAAAAVEVRVYFGAGKDPKEAGEYRLNPLEPGTTRSERLNIALPGSVNSVQLEVFDTTSPDTRPSNNVAAASMRLSGGGQADLQIKDGVVETLQPVEAKFINFHVQLINNGPEAVDKSTVKAELLMYQKPVATAVKPPGRMEPNEERQLRFNLMIPPEVPSGDAIIQVEWIPAENGAVDPSRGNNMLTLPVSIVPRMPDLMPIDVKVDSRGQLIFSIKNKGNAPAAATTTVVFLNGALVKKFNTPTLPPGIERRHIYGGTAIPAGTQITIVADYNADVAESSEENNRFQFMSQ